MTIFLFHSVPLQYAFFCYHLDFSRQNLPQKWKPEEDCSEDLQSIALGLLIVRSWYSSVKSKCIQFALNINRVFATKFMLVFSGFIVPMAVCSGEILTGIVVLALMIWWFLSEIVIVLKDIFTVWSEFENSMAQFV